MSIRIKQAIYDYGNTDQYGDPEHNVTISAQADITNDEDRNIEYIESSLILCDKDGLPVAQYNHNKERFLPPSESTSFSIGFHVDEELLEGQYDEELLKEKYNDAKLKLVVIPHTSYYAKIPSIPLADSSFTVTGTEEKINVDNLVTIEAVSVYHRSAGDENSKTCDVIVNCLITNLTDSYINKCVVKVNLFDSAERELAETMVEKPILPQAKAMIELELYDFSLYRLKNSRIQPELKIDMQLPPMMSESTLTLAKYNYIIEVKGEGEDIQLAIPPQEARDFARENNHNLEDLFNKNEYGDEDDEDDDKYGNEDDEDDDKYDDEDEKNNNLKNLFNKKYNFSDCKTIASYYGPKYYWLEVSIHSKSGDEELDLPNEGLKFAKIKEPDWEKIARQSYLRHYDEEFDFISITSSEQFACYEEFSWFRGNLILSEPIDLDKLKFNINSFGGLVSIEYDDQQIYVHVKDDNDNGNEYEDEYEDFDEMERKRPELPSYSINRL